MALPLSERAIATAERLKDGWVDGKHKGRMMPHLKAAGFNDREIMFIVNRDTIEAATGRNRQRFGRSGKLKTNAASKSSRSGKTRRQS